MGTIFMLYCNSVLHTYIPNIAMSSHQDHMICLAKSKFSEVPAGGGAISFLQIKSSMSLPEKIWHVMHQMPEQV